MNIELLMDIQLTRTVRTLALFSLAGFLFPVDNARAADRRAVSSGNWTNPATWTSGILPDAANNGCIDDGLTVTVDTDTPVAKYVYVGYYNSKPGVLHVSTGGLLTAENTYVGQNATRTGRLVQTSGVISNTGVLYIGNTGHGIYQMSGGTNFSRYVYVGSMYSGVATQTAGRLETTRLYLGNNAATIGAFYEISGGRINAAADKSGLRLGSAGAKGGHFKIVGTDPVITADYYFQTNAVLHVVLKAGGVSPIAITGNVLIRAESELRVEMDPAFLPYSGSDVTIMTYSGNRVGAFSTTNLITRNLVSDGIQYDTTAKAIRLLNVRYVPPGTVIKLR